MHPFSRKYTHKMLAAVLCAGAFFIAGCHKQNNISYYGTAWVDVTARPGNYTSYIITIDSITLTRTDGVVVSAASTPEIVDLTQVRNIAELWSSGSIPDGTYTSATITLDYTNAVLSTMINGKPVIATPVTTAVLDAYTDKQATTYSINVQFDPNNLPTITPTYASTSAVLLNLDFDLAASGEVVTTGDAVTVHVRPFVTIAMQSTDARLIRVRGPLINSSVDVNTYTVYIRPFYDEANNIGNLTLFSQPNSIYTLNGKTLIGSAGLDALAVLSAGTTVTAGYTTFQTDYNATNGATAGRFNLVYAIAGSTLEDVYTEGISGDVIARSGDTVTLQGATLFLNTADTFIYQTANCQVLIGSGTTVTADNNASLGTLTESAVSVGQHITTRGQYLGTSSFTCDPTSPILDSTGTKATNTGSVRLQNTEIWGTLVSSASGSLALDVQTINNWPVADFNFAGNGAGTVNPADFLIDTGSLALPAGSTTGEPLWISGYTTAFGAAPPDFTAVSVNNEASVQVAGGQAHGAGSTTPGTNACGIGSQVCDPAILEVSWTTATKTPFTQISSTEFSLDITGATADIRIGPEVISLDTLAATLVVIPTALTATSTFAPRFTVGDPSTSTITPTNVTAATFLQSYSEFTTWVSETQTLLATTGALQMAATGIYNRSTNTFTATSIDLVL